VDIADVVAQEIDESIDETDEDVIGQKDAIIMEYRDALAEIKQIVSDLS